MSQNPNQAVQTVPMGDYSLETAGGYDYVRPALDSGLDQHDAVAIQVSAMLNAARHGYAVGPMAEKFPDSTGRADQIYTAAAMTAGAMLARRSRSWP